MSDTLSRNREEDLSVQKVVEAGEIVAKLLDSIANAYMLKSGKSKILDPIIVELYEKGLYEFLRIKDFGRFLREVAVHHQNGDMLYGVDCAVNLEKAVYWYTKAGECGDVLSQFHIGNAYENGELGLEIDLSKAAYWYSKAAENGDEDAKERFNVVQAKIKKQ